jgi:hypothetical protein
MLHSVKNNFEKIQIFFLFFFKLKFLVFFDYFDVLILKKQKTLFQYIFLKKLF